MTIIREEHRKVAGLFDEAKGCEPDDERLRELAGQIQQELTAHLAVEERLFYAKLRDRAEESEEQVDMFEAYTEHAVAKTLLEMLRTGRKTDERFKAELQVLGEAVAHHVEEEESTVFELADELLEKGEAEEIGEAWERAKKRQLSGGASPVKKAAAAKRKSTGTRRR